MPKTGKLDFLTLALNDYRAPWEEDSDGTEISADEQDINGPTLKKLLYGLHRDKAKAQKARDDAQAKVAEHETKIGELQDQVDAAGDGEADPQVAEKVKAQGKQIRELTTDLAKARKTSDAPTKREMQLEAALTAGLTLDWVDRLHGADLDELVEDAEKIKAAVGAAATSRDGDGDNDDDGDGDGDDDAHNVTGRPREPAKVGRNPVTAGRKPTRAGRAAGLAEASRRFSKPEPAAARLAEAARGYLSSDKGSSGR